MATIASLLSFFVLAGLGGGVTSGDGDQAVDIAEIVRQVRSIHAASPNGDIRFEQSGAGSTVVGRLLYGTGDRYRLELPKQTIVSDGVRTWTYTPQRSQVVISRAAQGSQRITPEKILTSFPGNYTTTLEGSTTVNGRAVWIVRCTPDGHPTVGDVTKATLYVDKATSRFQRVVIESSSLGEVQLRIIAANYRPSITPSSFSFTPPAGARVVDLSR